MTFNDLWMASAATEQLYQRRSTLAADAATFTSNDENWTLEEGASSKEKTVPKHS